MIPHGSRTIYDAKMFVERSLAFHNDALHVMAGLVLALVFAALLRRSLADWLPWLAVLALELLNEANDYFFEVWPNEVAKQLGEMTKDVALTIALPTLMLVVARCWPHLLSGRRDKPNKDDSAGGDGSLPLDGAA
ncbi:hypothetical protein OKA06_16700 [Novosphingobium sp. MW5]|nr:hypothetical protein [Novosphingobium sp. MW5]